MSLSIPAGIFLLIIGLALAFTLLTLSTPISNNANNMRQILLPQDALDAKQGIRGTVFISTEAFLSPTPPSPGSYSWTVYSCKKGQPISVLSFTNNETGQYAVELEPGSYDILRDDLSDRIWTDYLCLAPRQVQLGEWVERSLSIDETGEFLIKKDRERHEREWGIR